MKRILLLTLGFALCVSGAEAHVDPDFGFATDIEFTSCALVNLVPPPALNSVYLFQEFNGSGSTAAQFKIVDTSGLFFAGMSSPYLVIGTWNTDLAIAYGSCVLGRHVLATLEFFWFGEPITGCNNRLDVAPAPTSPLPGEIAIVGCDYQTLRTGYADHMYVGADAIECRGGGCCWCAPVPVHAATWGSIKAMFR